MYLLEDGLELWFAVLENSTTLSPQLFHLYKVMPSILSKFNGFDCKLETIKINKEFCFGRLYY